MMEIESVTRLSGVGLAGRTMSRRRLLAGATRLMLTSLLPLQTVQGAISHFGSAPGKAGVPALASAFTLEERHYIGVLDGLGSILWKHEVPSRGHAAAVSPDRRWVAFSARRPGTWLAVINAESGALLPIQTAAEGYHYYGHAVFTHDGAYLLTTENDFGHGMGKIGIYEVATQFSRVGELSAFGVGPHELGLLSNGTLVVANGGILTHPDYERRKLNLDTMAPRLSYIDWQKGELLREFAPPHAKLSLRHMAIAADDTVVLGAQYQGPLDDDWPLVFFHRQGSDRLQPFAGHPPEQRRMLQQYIASVVVAPDNRVVTTAPRGNRVSFWSLEDGRWLGDAPRTDVGGAAFPGNTTTCWVSSGDGGIYQWQAEKFDLVQRTEWLQWDNHLSVFPVS
ncbi:MAG: DUF1513 domain-containing protein [Hahellaceae bacterium]|nr:DUF1513 domain-containing protein [Hahellaceae bacterium]